MVFIPKVVGLMACGFLLCLGLASLAQAGPAASRSDQAVRKGGEAGVRAEQGKLKGSHKIKGEVLRIEGDSYLVMGQDEKEVRLHTDRSTKKTGNIRQGDRIVTDVNDQNHARSIRAADMADLTDRRPGNTDHTPASNVESGKTGMMEH